jgi:hypothetical protein
MEKRRGGSNTGIFLAEAKRDVKGFRRGERENRNMGWKKRRC